MRSLLLTLCAVFALVVVSTNVRAGDAPSVDNAPIGQLVQPSGTVVNGSAWSINAPIPNVNGTSQTTTASDSNGNVYVIGGGARGGPGEPDVTLNTLWMYSPPDDSWTQLANVPTPLRAFGSVTRVSTPLEGSGVADFLYVFGGFDGVSPVNTLNIYDVLNDAWFQGAPIPPTGGGFGVGVCQVNGRIFLAGGSNSTTAAFEYHVDTNTYTTIAPMGGGGAYRTHCAGVDATDDCHCFANGFDSNFHVVYHVGGNNWTVGPFMPLGVTGPAVVALNGLIYVMGSSVPVTPARTQIFDAVNNMWLPNDPSLNLPSPLNDTSGTLVINPAAGPLTGTIYVEGGFDDNNYSLPVPVGG